MKKEKLEIKIDMLINLIADWCSRKHIEFRQNDHYSIYFNLKDVNFDEFKNELKEYLLKESGMKKFKKIFTFLHSKGRTYLLFKTRIENFC